VGANTYLTWGNGSVVYMNLGARAPPFPTIHLGSNDHSVQRLVYESVEGKYCLIRYEGTNNWYGALDQPDAAFEVAITAYGYIEYRVCGVAVPSGTTGVTNGTDFLLKPLPVDSSFVLSGIDSAATLSVASPKFLELYNTGAPTKTPTLLPTRPTMYPTTTPSEQPTRKPTLRPTRVSCGSSQGLPPDRQSGP
jgi:hypothetical protein